MTNDELRYELECFIEYVMGGYEVDEKNSDEDYIFFYDTDEFIKIINITDKVIDYSICVPGLGCAEEIVAGRYHLIYTY